MNTKLLAAIMLTFCSAAASAHGRICSVETAAPAADSPAQTAAQTGYIPTEENLQRRAEFEGFRLGIFIHWGIYSTFAQGEWYLSSGLDKEEYAKAADAFYPHRFDADAWVQAIKDAGAGYITFTTRHHDGFSMWDTRQSDYNIVRATPFGRDVLKELSEACLKEGIRLHLYYSLLDWIRDDYPAGRTGRRSGRDTGDYDSYFSFMKRQLHELLTEYGPVGGLWLDGWWDHKDEAEPFDWRMTELYGYVHALRPELLIGNNHHVAPIDGEDFQMFERDLPGENTAGFSAGQQISRLPLEMCQTMNGMWGYKVSDTKYKSTDELITLIVRAAAKGSNLLLNIGPQPNGELPAAALDRLRGIGQWMRRYGHSIRNTSGGSLSGHWGVSTCSGNTLYLHVLDRTARSLTVSLSGRPRSVRLLDGRESQWHYDKRSATLEISLPEHDADVDCIVTIVR